jgi:hypothetical protein
MLSLTETGATAAAKNEDATTGPADRYAAYSTSHLAEINGTTAANLATSWTNKTGSAADANLAKRLTYAIVSKGLTSTNTLATSKLFDNTLTTAQQKEKLAYIVRQVVGQDATRLMNEDNSERTLDVSRLLRFYEGDIIYVNIKLKTPTISFDTVAPGIAKTTFENSYDEQNYTLKITLGPKEDL